MKIERIESLKANTNSNFKAKSTNNPVNTPYSSNELNGITAAYYDINFGGSYEANNKRKFAKASANFTPEAHRLWKEIEDITKRFGHTKITHQHVFLATLVDLNNFIESLNSGTKKYDEEEQYLTAKSFESFIGDFNALKNEETRKKIEPIIKKYIRETAQEIKKSNLLKSKFFTPKPTDELVADLNIAYSATTQMAETDEFLDNNFMVALLSSNDRKLLSKLKDFKFEIQREIMIDSLPEKQKTHLNFYDDKADQLWKSLDHGNDTYITYEGDNKTSVKHLISSFTNLIKKPGQKYNKLNEQNTKIVLFNSKTTFDIIKSMAEEAKKDPDTTYIFMANFAELLKANTAAAEDTQLKQLQGKQIYRWL